MVFSFIQDERVSPKPQKNRSHYLRPVKYSRALLFHTESPFTEERQNNDNRISRTLVRMEGEMFKDGPY